MNTKSSENSSGLVAVAWSVLNGVHTPLVRLSDAEEIINDLQTLVIAENQRKQQLEAEVAAKDAEIMEQCRINGMGAERELSLLAQVAAKDAEIAAWNNDAINGGNAGYLREVAEHQAERIKELETQFKQTHEWLCDRNQQIHEQSAALKLARGALADVMEWCICQDSNFYKPCEEAIAAIAALKGE